MLFLLSFVSNCKQMKAKQSKKSKSKQKKLYKYKYKIKKGGARGPSLFNNLRQQRAQSAAAGGAGEGLKTIAHAQIGEGGEPLPKIFSNFFEKPLYKCLSRVYNRHVLRDKQENKGE